MVESEIQNMKAMDESEERQIRSAEEKLKTEGKATAIQEESRLFVQASSDLDTEEQREPRRVDVQRKPLPAQTARPELAEKKPLHKSIQIQEENGNDTDSDAESVHHQIQMIDLDPTPEPDEHEAGRRI
jgi:hypothetical protein